MRDPILDNQDLLRKALDTIPVGVWIWNVDDGEEWWSKKYYELLGYKEGEIAPNEGNFDKLICHPDDLEKIQGTYREYWSKGVQRRERIRLRHKSGEYRWFLSSGQSMQSASGSKIIVGFVVDIHDEVEIREQIARNELFLEETGNIAKLGGWEVNLETMDTVWTKAVYKIHELEEGTPVSIDDAINFYHPDDQDRIRKDFQAAVEEKKPYNDVYRFITAKGNEIYVQGIGIPIENEEGKVSTVRGIFQDIDERKRAELLMEETLAIATEQNQKLINFAHIVSHNLRNHTSNLEMLVDFALNTKVKEDRDELLMKIGEVSNNLSDTIAHLNEIVKVQNTVNKHVERINITSSVLKILDVLSGDMKKAEAYCDIQLPDDLFCHFAPAYLDSIFLNLFSNALRYQSPDRKLHLKVSQEEDEEYIMVHVADNGLGIDLKKHKNRIFRLYSTFHSHPDSRGVGLYISKSQMESLGGKLTVESEPGVGTTFTLHFHKIH
ncbi:MAG: PAS domain-containing protein [Flavobacteriia bacterium]|nr:PAS domain-containing protein [Flavobacteriia bacterium]